MSMLEILESTIRTLEPDQLAEFDADSWDARIEADAAAGKLDALAEGALKENRRGEAREP